MNINQLKNKIMNLVEILKDVPKGTQLYSTVYGYITLRCVSEDEIESYPIKCITKNINISFTKEGKIYKEYDGECILFPSKENRDWSTFVTDLKPLTPCICFDRIENGINYYPLLRYYKCKGRVYDNGLSYGANSSYNYIIPSDKYIFETGIFFPKDNYGTSSGKNW